ncbi:MAG: alpha/beta hydrolase [Erythrobacter sp.]|jgi:acetyl esterase/lipase|nr:alpha/beta hydrolase [Erythrobacter sp.]
MQRHPRHALLAGGTALALGAALMGALMTGPTLAQRPGPAGEDERLSSKCRQEVRRLCLKQGSRAPGMVRACLEELADQLTPGCRAELGVRIEQRRAAEASPRIFQRTLAPARGVVYGPDARQQIDLYEAADAVDDQPLVLFIHGGGWRMGSRELVQAKPVHFTDAGYYFASAGYRLLPQAPVEEQARDIGAAIRALVGQAGAIGFDPSQIVLMGHSAGAHLAALVAADPAYAGEAFGAIRAVILLDGAGYDVPAQMASARARASTVEGAQALNLYRDAFGEAEPRQRALSPITHVGGPDAPHWLALYVEEREASKVQSEALAQRLRAAGVEAQAVAIPGTDHGRMNRELGTAAAQTQAVDAFLAEVFGERASASNDAASTLSTR